MRIQREEVLVAITYLLLIVQELQLAGFLVVLQEEQDYYSLHTALPIAPTTAS